MTELTDLYESTSTEEWEREPMVGGSESPLCGFCEERAAVRETRSGPRCDRCSTPTLQEREAERERQERPRPSKCPIRPTAAELVEQCVQADETGRFAHDVWRWLRRSLEDFCELVDEAQGRTGVGEVKR